MKTTRLFVGGLGDQLSKEDVEREFSKYGKLTQIWVAQNPPGFGFIEYDDERDADEAIREMNGQVINGARLRVEHSRESRGRGFRGGRGGGFRGERGGGFRGNFRGGDRGFSRGGFRSRDDFGGGRGSYERRGSYDSYRGSRSYGGGRRDDYSSRDAEGDYSGKATYRSRSPAEGRYSSYSRNSPPY